MPWILRVNPPEAVWRRRRRDLTLVCAVACHVLWAAVVLLVPCMVLSYNSARNCKLHVLFVLAPASNTNVNQSRHVTPIRKGEKRVDSCETVAVNPSVDCMRQYGLGAFFGWVLMAVPIVALIYAVKAAAPNFYPYLETRETDKRRKFGTERSKTPRTTRCQLLSWIAYPLCSPFLLLRGAQVFRALACCDSCSRTLCVFTWQEKHS